MEFIKLRWCTFNSLFLSFCTYLKCRPCQILFQGKNSWYRRLSHDLEIKDLNAITSVLFWKLLDAWYHWNAQEMEKTEFSFHYHSKLSIFNQNYSKITSNYRWESPMMTPLYFQQLDWPWVLRTWRVLEFLGASSTETFWFPDQFPTSPKHLKRRKPQNSRFTF